MYVYLLILTKKRFRKVNIAYNVVNIDVTIFTVWV